VKKTEPSEASLSCYLYKLGNFRVVISYPNAFGSYVDQVGRLLALSYGRREAIRHKTHCKRPFNKPLVKGWKDIDPEILKSDTL
jgi:hypothetical protein